MSKEPRCPHSMFDAIFSWGPSILMVNIQWPPLGNHATNEYSHLGNDWSLAATFYWLYTSMVLLVGANLQGGAWDEKSSREDVLLDMEGYLRHANRVKD